MPEHDDPLIRSFPLAMHLRETLRARKKREHVKVGLQNWLVTHLLANAGRVRPKTPVRFTPRPGHWHMIEKEAHSLAPKDEMLRLMTRLPFQRRPALGAIDWEAAITEYADLDYPAWYLQPQHSFRAATCVRVQRSMIASRWKHVTNTPIRAEAWVYARAWRSSCRTPRIRCSTLGRAWAICPQPSRRRVLMRK